MKRIMVFQLFSFLQVTNLALAQQVPPDLNTPLPSSDTDQSAITGDEATKPVVPVPPQVGGQTGTTTPPKPVPAPAPKEPEASAPVSTPVVAPATSTPEAAPTTVVAEKQDDPDNLPGYARTTPKAIADEPWMNGFGFVPQVGYAYFPESAYDFNGLTLHVDKRNSFIAKLQLDLGGPGVALQLAPLFAFEQIGGDFSTIGADLGTGVGGKILAIGGDVNLVLRASWGEFYPHVGIGFHGAYLAGDDIQYGAQMYGRIPMGFSVYPAESLGLTVEFAFMYGATGIRGPDPDPTDLAALETKYNIDVNQVDWENTTPEAFAAQHNISDQDMTEIMNDTISKSIKFGRGYAFELTVGLRFP